MKIYTRKGDDGTTGLLYGGVGARTPISPPRTGVVDEAQAVLGIARGEAERGGELDDLLVSLERDMYVLMAELATAPENRGKLTPGQSSVTPEMIERLEPIIDSLTGRFEQPTEFVLPGQSRIAAYLDLARTVVRRAERAVARRRTAALARRALPEPPFRSAVDHGSMAGRCGVAGSAGLTEKAELMSITFTVTRSAPQMPTPSASASSLRAPPRARSASTDRASRRSGSKARSGKHACWRAAARRRGSRSDSGRRGTQPSPMCGGQPVRSCAQPAGSRRSPLALSRPRGFDAKAGAQAVVEGAALGSYSFTRYKSEAPKPGVSSVAIMASEAAAKATQAGVDRGSAIAAAVAMARDLVNTPGGSLDARDMAELATEVAKDNGLTIEVMDEHAMEQAGLGGMLGVNRGSDEPPRLIKLTYTPRNPTGSVVLVGKGIMFDSGGLSLKSGEGMMSMKIDMSGAAAVLATMTTLKATKPRVKVIGFLCCTDNMPSGTALKPGDVITIRNGKTVEVLNTDAEGRLVLADGLSLAVEEDVDAIIDLATLTGAVVGALGNRIAGVMGNDDVLMEQVRDAASRADELVWPLPLPAEYRKFLDSPVADLKNIGGTSVLGSGAGEAVRSPWGCS